MLDVIEKAIEQARERIASKETYIKAGEQLKHCSICHEPVECDVEHFGIVPCTCSCDMELIKQQRVYELKQHQLSVIQANKDNGIKDGEYLNYRFERDDSPKSMQSIACRRYVEAWPEMQAGGIGLMLTGAVGTGKTFHAACIVNELLDQGVKAGIFTLTYLIDHMFGSRDKDAAISWIQSFQLLVIDDFGVERDTEYSREQIFNIIDARSRSGKVTLFTTNLNRASMEKEQGLAYKRIYDRVLHMSPVSIAYDGASRRTAETEDKRRTAFSRLFGKD